jgi:transcription elongation factor Elf1
MIVEEVKILFECVRCKGRVTSITYTSKELEEYIKNASLRCTYCHPIKARRRIVYLSAKRSVDPTTDIKYWGTCPVCGAHWSALVAIPQKFLRDALTSSDLAGYAECLQCKTHAVDVLRTIIWS